MVNVTLCKAPSTDAESYGKSLASFEYVADSAKAFVLHFLFLVMLTMASSVSLLFKLLNGRLLIESMPLIQRLLQRGTGTPESVVQPGPVDSNISFPSSLPESAFLDILSALKPLPDFPQLLATANKQGQTLLHLAVDLRYRELVQKLIHWRVDLNVRDVNGFTALHVAYLCDDPFAISVLTAGGATPFILDELGRSPTGLTATIRGTSGMTTRNDVPPLVRPGPSAPFKFNPVPRSGSSRGPPLPAPRYSCSVEATVTPGHLARSPYVHGSLLKVLP